MIRLTPRFFVLPLIALIVIGSLSAPAGPGRTNACGPSVGVQAPGIHDSFVRFERSESAAARKICEIYRAFRLSLSLSSPRGSSEPASEQGAGRRTR